MERRPCGSSDLDLSVLGLGCWQFGDDTYWRPASQKEIDRVVHRAVDLGINYFDTAEAYADGRSEKMLARALEGIPRDRVVIGTKLSPSNAYPGQLVEHCEASLRRLNTDYIDLYMVHWPLNPESIRFFTDDEEVINHPPQPEDVFPVLDRLQKEGKIRYAGVSNFGIEQMHQALSLKDDIAVNQVAYNLLSRAIEEEVLPLCRGEGVGVVGYSALMQGILANVYDGLDDIPMRRTRTRHFDHERSEASRHGEDGAEEELIQALKQISDLVEETGYTMAELALKWPLAREGLTSMLVGSTDVDHLDANARAVEEPLPKDIANRLDVLTQPLEEKLGNSIDYYEGTEQARSR